MLVTVWLTPCSAIYSDAVTLPECVNAWLKSTGIMQNVVAERAGLKPSQISEIAAGKIDPRWSTIEKLALGFGVSPSAFLAGPRLEGDFRHEHVGNESGGSGLADSLRRALADYEQTGQFPNDWRGDIMLAIFTLTRALQRPAATGGAEGQVKQA